MGRIGPAARITDPTAHLMTPLAPGPGSANVIIGNLLAWRGLPAGAAAALQAQKQASEVKLKAAQAATIAAAPTPGGPAAKAAEETLKGVEAAAMGAAITGAAAASATPSGGMTDIHICPMPIGIIPHGPGVVIDGSATVLINDLPACRMGDTILEALGPPNKIVMGLFTVLIGEGTATRSNSGGSLDMPIDPKPSGPAGPASGGGGGGGGGAAPVDPKKQAIEQARKDAIALLKKALDDVKKWDDATKARSRKWFGDDSEETRKLMQERIEKEIAKLESFTTDNFVPAEPGEEDCYAYVYPDKDDKVYLGNDFDNAPATGSDSKAGTLIHEVSHYDSVGGTDDVALQNGKTAYGHEKCEQLAKENPEGAKKNADSFEYFVEGG